MSPTCGRHRGRGLEPSYNLHWEGKSRIPQKDWGERKEKDIPTKQKLACVLSAMISERFTAIRSPAGGHVCTHTYMHAHTRAYTHILSPHVTRRDVVLGGGMHFYTSVADPAPLALREEENESHCVLCGLS